MTLDEILSLPQIQDSNGLSVIPKLPGVYAIVNRHTKRVYVGSADDLRKRCGQHINGLKSGVAANGVMRRDLRKYGYEHFACVALDTFASTEEAGHEYRLAAREAARIKELGTYQEKIGYNSILGCEWSKGACFRDRERKLIRGGSYFLLEGVDLYDPISDFLLNSWMRDQDNPGHWRRRGHHKPDDANRRQN